MNDSEDGSAEDSFLNFAEEYDAEYQKYNVFFIATDAVRLLLAFLGVITNCTVCGVLL